MADKQVERREFVRTKFPKYYKAVPAGVTEVDFYRVCRMFDVNDQAIGHALKKLLLPGVRSGGKSFADDVREARDTLNRFLELQDEDQTGLEPEPEPSSFFNRMQHRGGKRV